MQFLVLIAVFGAWLGFANPLYQLPLAAAAFPLGLSWIAFRAGTWKQAFGWAWLAGALACTGVLYWMVVPVTIYGGIPWFFALPCPVLAAAALGVYYALYAVTVHYCARHVGGLFVVGMAGVAWAVMEMLMGTLLSGFPWINLASAFIDWPIVVQSASVVGTYGLSGLIAAFSVSALLCNTYRVAANALTALLLALVLGFGFFALPAQTPPVEGLNVVLVQGNIDQSHKWDAAYQNATVSTYAELSRKASVDVRPDMIVWPETAMPFYLQDETPYTKAVSGLAQDLGTVVMTGAPAYEVTDFAKREYILFNRAFFLRPDGTFAQGYDKEHLVPFGEYMPFEEWLPFEKLVEVAGNFVSGENRVLPSVKGIRAGVLICYEAIFPELAQKQVANGAQFLVNISNDAWFGDTSAPVQHLALSRMRAVEQGRWMARCTNNGITVLVDPQGRIRSSVPRKQAVALSGIIQPLTDTTVYHTIHDTLGPLLAMCLFTGLAFVAYRARRDKK